MARELEVLLYLTKNGLILLERNGGLKRPYRRLRLKVRSRTMYLLVSERWMI